MKTLTKFKSFRANVMTNNMSLLDAITLFAIALGVSETVLQLVSAFIKPISRY